MKSLSLTFLPRPPDDFCVSFPGKIRDFFVIGLSSARTGNRKSNGGGKNYNSPALRISS